MGHQDSVFSPFFCSEFLYGHIFPDLDPSFLEEVLGEIVGITLAIDDLLDTRVDEDLGTHRTGVRCGIYGGTIDTDTEIGCLGHCILLCVYASTELVPRTGRDIEFHTYTAQFFAVLCALGRPVVTSGKDPLLLDDDSAYSPPETGGTRGYQLCHLHEVFVIAGSIHLLSFRENVKGVTDIHYYNFIVTRHFSVP